MKVLLVFTLAFTTYILSALCKNESILILALPQRIDYELALIWERGDEILPGALAAAEIINSDSSLPPLKLVMADSGPVTRYDHPYSGNVLEVVANLTWQKRSEDIVGIAGVLRPDILLSLRHFQSPLASLVHVGGIPDIPNALFMTASTTTLIDSILAFIKNLNLSNIGMITEQHDSYFSRFSKDFYSRIEDSPQFSVQPQVHIGLGYQTTAIIDQVVRTNVRAIVLNVHPSVSLEVLREAHKRHLTWPKYVWIVHSHSLDEINLNGSIKFTNGILTFQLVQNNPLIKPCLNYPSDTLSRLQHQIEINAFSYPLFNAVLTLALARNGRSTNGSECSDNRNNMVYVYQMLDNVPAAVGIYDGGLETFITNNETFPFNNIPLPVDLKEFPLPYLVPFPLLCIITNSVLLVLYLWFRKEPSVKSTSVSLSLLMFFGCYLLAVYTITLMVDESQSVKPLSLDFCMVHIWLSGIGLSMPLILATLLVKMLRVYHIISLRRIMKRKLYTSNCAHFVYVFLILLPHVAILVLWTIIDPYRNSIQYVEHPGFFTVDERCVCDNLALWSVLLLINTILLSLVVVVVAIKSRKIRLKQFKDTKKVNLLIFLILFIGVSTYGYWAIFTLNELYGDAPSYILIIGHITISFLCQAILFVPKVWPPLRAKHQAFLSRRTQSSATGTEETSTTGLSK